MKNLSIKRAAAAIAVTGLASAGAIGGPATAAAGDAAPGPAGATIDMVQRGHGFSSLGFSGPRKINSGATLTIVNATDPAKVGPHTLTLVKRGKLPRTKKQMKRCEQTKGVCKAIARAHAFVPPDTINRPDVDVGRPGWDRSFGRRGDSWFTAAKGEQTSRVVAAKPGTTLYYFCVVHPFMTGKIKVVR